MGTMASCQLDLLKKVSGDYYRFPSVCIYVCLFSFCKSDNVENAFATAEKDDLRMKACQ